MIRPPPRSALFPSTTLFRSLSVATHRILACYQGTASYLASGTSGSYQIDKATTTTTVNSTPASPQQLGTDVTFTGTVKVGTAAVKEGQRKVYDAGPRTDYFP